MKTDMVVLTPMEPLVPLKDSYFNYWPRTQAKPPEVFGEDTFFFYKQQRIAFVTFKASPRKLRLASESTA